MDNKRCGFCGQIDDNCIKGIESYICPSCVDIIFESMEKEEFNNKFNILKPHEIKAKLDEYVIGQDEAKKKIAVEVYNHYKRINSKPSLKTDFPKNNILLIGPTGSGKTYILKKLGEILDIPIAFGDANELTASGYVGKDIDNLLISLIENADGDIKKAEHGIIYIDEIDKINKNVDDKDIGTVSVQQSLLTIMDGSEYVFDTKKQKFKYTSIDTKNILFICGGAFVGLEDVIKSRLNKGTTTIGFGANTNKSKYPKDILKEVTVEDLFKFGFIKEFIGRLPLVAVLENLTEDTLKTILTKPKNSIVKQYKALFRSENVKLNFNDESLSYIAKIAIKKGTGARGLKNIVAETMSDLMFDLPQNNVKELNITKEMLENKFKEA